MKKANPTILVVDDDVNDLIFIQAAFKSVGVTSHCHTTRGGDQAIAYLMGEGKYADRALYGYPDFVITDLKMPGLDGFGVLRFLKSDADRATIPVVVLSGSQDDDDIQKSYLLGASSYHLKPGGLVELRDLISALYHYWVVCEVPAADSEGKKLTTGGVHKLGARLFEAGHPRSIIPFPAAEPVVKPSVSQTALN